MEHEDALVSAESSSDETLGERTLAVEIPANPSSEDYSHIPNVVLQTAIDLQTLLPVPGPGSLIARRSFDFGPFNSRGNPTGAPRGNPTGTLRGNPSPGTGLVADPSAPAPGVGLSAGVEAPLGGVQGGSVAQNQGQVQGQVQGLGQGQGGVGGSVQPRTVANAGGSFVADMPVMVDFSANFPERNEGEGGPVSRVVPPGGGNNGGGLPRGRGRVREMVRVGNQIRGFLVDRIETLDTAATILKGAGIVVLSVGIVVLVRNRHKDK